MRIDYEKELNEEQYDAVKTTEGPVLIIAGAGTGKTRTMVYRTAYLLEHCAAATEILMLTFTNKAANEMKERVIELLGENVASNITACTFHSFCVTMLRRFANEININTNFTILSTSDDVDIINMKKTESTEHRYDKKGFPPSAKIAEVISQSINRNMSVEDVLKENKYSRYYDFLDDILELKKITDEYKRENSLLNYDDLLLEMNRLLETHPNIAKKISDIYRYIMVDEYQDTNSLQDAILFLLRTDNKNLAVVGDDMQSLYAFRGANVENIISFPKRMENCKVIKLVKNYRSNQEILNLSNFAVTYATEGFQKKLEGMHYAYEKPQILSVYTQAQEADAVMNLIEELHDNDGLNYNDICILGRNSFLTIDVEASLRRDGIPYVKFGGPKFFDLEYVRTILSYCRVMVKNNDEIAWFRILKVHSGIGDFNAKKIAAKCKEFGIDHLIDKQYEKRVYASELKILYKELKKLEDLKLTEMMTEVIDFYTNTNERNIQNMRLSDESKRTALLDENENHHTQLQALIPITEKYNTILEFLDDLVMDNTALTQNEDVENSIVLSTIHSIKGLEYKAVIIMDCIDGIFPSTEEKDMGSKEDNEELRCFYVALTRAKDKLFLISPQNAKVFNKPMRGKLSHYLYGADGLYEFCRYCDY